MDALKIKLPPALPPPPRHIHVKPGGCGARFASFVYSVLLLTAVLSLAVIPVRWYVQGHGTTVLVTVESKYIAHSAKGGDSYTVRFNYPYEGKTIHDGQSVNQTEYLKVKPRSVFSGKASRVLGFNVCLANMADVSRVTRHWILVTLLWNGISWFVVGVSVKTVLSTRRLLQQGTAVPGTVTNRRIARRKNTSWYVAYQFQTMAGEILNHERDVSRSGYDSVEIGSVITVLYDPNNIKNSVLYECCNYTIEDR